MKTIVSPREEYTDKDKEYIEKAIGFMTANVRNYLRFLKERAGDISFREISRRTGVSIAVLSDIEGNKYLPKMEVLLKLAYGMNSSFSTLLKYMWNSEDIKRWFELTHISPSQESEISESDIYTVLPKENFDRQASRNVVAEIVNDIKNNLNEQEKEGLMKNDAKNLHNELEKEGLTKNDIKEILDFIDFKKNKRKRK